MKAESEPRQQKIDYRLVALDKCSDGIAIFDAQGGLLYANPALVQFYNIEPSIIPSLTGAHWKTVLLQAQSVETQAAIHDELERNGELYGEISIQVSDQQKTAEVSLTKLEDGGIIATLRDSEDRQDVERERQALKEQLHQAQKLEAVGRLAGGIAHDFNNILAAMNGFAEFLVDDLENGSEEQTFAKNILKAGNQARDLVDKMMAFSRRDDGSATHIDLRDALQETITMLKASLPKTVTVNVQMPPESVFIMGNATQIKQALMNLCVNAKDAMEGGRGTLSLSIDTCSHKDYPFVPEFSEAEEDKDLLLVDITEEPENEAGLTRLTLGSMSPQKTYYRLIVKDNGSGMSRLIMENIFEPFFTTKAVDKGTGLGLAMVHGVIAAHNASMVILSKMGEGTSFEILFPAASSDETQSAEHVKPLSESREMCEAKILLVEDQEEVAQMTLKMLERMGCEAEHCDNGYDAITVLRENPGYFDVVITDQNMPKMTGLEMIMELNLECPDMPFILLSGYSEERMRKLMEQNESIKYILRKPVSKDELYVAVQKTVQNKKEASSA